MEDESSAIRRLKQGDIGGLEQLVRRYQLPALRAAYLVTRDRELAEDVVQMAFLRAYERIAQFDARRSFGPWFLRSVINSAIKAATRDQRQVSLERPTGPDGLSHADQLVDLASLPDEYAEQAELRRAIWEALCQLPPAQRAAVVQRYYLDQSDSEMAAADDHAPGTIRWRLHVARRRLRMLLAPLRDPAPATVPAGSESDALRQPGWEE